MEFTTVTLRGRYHPELRLKRAVIGYVTEPFCGETVFRISQVCSPHRADLCYPLKFSFVPPKRSFFQIVFNVLGLLLGVAPSHFPSITAIDLLEQEVEDAVYRLYTTRK